MAQQVQVTDYNPAWPALFIQEADRLRQVLGPNCAVIYHIGSTAVPGLAAKPIIDIMPVVRDLAAVDTKQADLAALGYEYMGEFGIPGRRYLRKGGDLRTCQVHIFAQGDRANIQRHLKFRDYLRTHPEACTAYAQLKRRLAAQFPADIAGYCAGKAAFVQALEAKAEAALPCGPDPDALFPVPGLEQVCFIKNAVTGPNIQIGDYTYYDDDTGAQHFQQHVTHHYPFLGDKLIIGKFCAIAKGVTFVMNGANHRMCSVTTYPFNILGGGWEKATPTLEDLPLKGDTVVGNDVWIGQNVTILPGVHIGDGAIIAANAVVSRDVPPYAIAGGNPCRILRQRFDDALTAYLLQLRWWDWTPYEIHTNLEALCSGDLEKIRQIGR